MKRFVLITTLLALIPIPVVGQVAAPLIDGIAVIEWSSDRGAGGGNTALVSVNGGHLVVDPGPATMWAALARAIGTSPATRTPLVVRTGTGTESMYAVPPGMLALLPASSPIPPDPRDGRQVFQSPFVLEDGNRRVEVLNLGDGARKSSVVVHVPTDGVLFAGNLVGGGRDGDLVPTAVWSRALEQLERLRPETVVPGHGSVTGPDVLAETRLALIAAKNQIDRSIRDGVGRGQIAASIPQDALAILPEGTVDHIYEESVGLEAPHAFIDRLGLREAGTTLNDDPNWKPPTKVVVSDLWPGRTEQLRLAVPGLEVVVVDDAGEEARAVRDADAYLGWLTPETFAAAERLRWVQLPAAGVESFLAIPGLAESNILITNAQRLYAHGGAEHVMAMLLTLTRRLHIALELQRERRWDIEPLTGPSPYVGAGSELLELRGKTMLVAGLGGIGTEVARLGHGFGMRVVATRASRREGPAFVDYVGLSSELHALAADADVVVNSLPLTPTTQSILDERFFSTVKRSAYFLNIGRGKTVDTDALVRALRDGRLAGAGLDVTEPEPLPADHVLWGMKNVIITPHLGGDSDDHMERLWLVFRENLRRFANGEKLLSVVNKERGY